MTNEKIAMILSIIILTIQLFPLFGNATPNVLKNFQDDNILSNKIIVDQSGSGDYIRIQDAIDNSSDGDTIYVHSGNYTEQLVINKSISLIGIGNPLLYHVEKDSINILISCDNVILKNISIINSNEGRSKGILIKANNISIDNIDCLSRNGIVVENVESISISNCRLNTSLCSIELSGTKNIFISDNTIINFVDMSSKIYLGSSINAYISSNIFIGGYYPQGSWAALISNQNSINVTISNHFISNCSNAISGGNVVKNNVFYKCGYVGAGGEAYNNTFIKIGEVSISEAYDNTFKNCSLISAHGSNGANIYHNNFSYNNIGIKVKGSDNYVKIHDNSFYHNKKGAVLSNAPLSVLWGNRFIDNDIQAEASDSGYSWNARYPVGGNYWSDYSGTKDVKSGSQQNEYGSDGFGDSAYVLGKVRDNYPIFTDNIKPTAIAGSDITLNLGEIYHFNGTDSSDDQMITHYSWSFEYDNENITIEQAEFNFRFSIAGTYDCILNVSDFAGNHDTDNISITVKDLSPPRVISQGNITIDQGHEADFTAAGTKDLSGVKDYIWKFEYDGEHIELHGIIAHFIFNTTGVYEVILEAVDSCGNSGYNIFYVTVRDTEDPVANPGPNMTITNGESANLDASESHDNGIIEEYTWLFHYGGNEITLTGENVSYSFLIPGYYSIALTVTDSYGNSDTKSMILTVVDTIPPEAVITGRTKLIEGESLSLSGISSKDNGKIVKYVWNFTDGQDMIVEGPYLNHTFQTQGYHDVTLTVYDQFNNSDSKTVTVEVPDTEKPHAVAGDDLFARKGEVILLDGSSSWDNTDIKDYRWKFEYHGEEMNIKGEKMEFTFDQPGTYRIELVVTDIFLNRGSDIVNVTILDNGTISGIVTDSKGEPITGAKVTVKDEGGKEYTTLTDTEGRFSISVPSGIVSWKIEKNGFKNKKGTAEVEIMEEVQLSGSDTVLKESQRKTSPISVIFIILAVMMILGTLAVLFFFLMKHRKGSSDEGSGNIPQETRDDGASQGPEQDINNTPSDLGEIFR